VTALEQRLAAITGGDPQRSRKWSRQSLQRLATDLSAVGHPASPNTLRRLLRQRDYSLRVNRKRLTGPAHPQRDAQFGQIEAEIRAFLTRGWPVLSVDTKKRELIGLFKNPGRVWRNAPAWVNEYDFPSLAEGVAIPYGLYDVARNIGYVCVGTSHDTAEFAVDAMVWWWTTYAPRYYRHAPALLILADGGGSNSCRTHLWKYSVQHRLVNPSGLAVTVCHYPTGASKWNPVEHRLFGPISTNWAGEPLTSYARMLNFIRGTTTQSGLIVYAKLNRRTYQTGIAISEKQMEHLNLQPFDQLPAWNYTLKPQRD
jgi:hypothetical protein